MSKLALLTGGSGGLGSAIKAALLGAGWHVAAPTHAELDLTDLGAVEQYARMTPAPDAIICAQAAPMDADFQKAVILDLSATGYLVEQFAPGMIANGGGRVVLFSSIRARQPRESQAAYAAAKSGVEGLTRGLAVACAKGGVFVNCIAPGAIPTPRTTANIAAGRVSEAELVARTPLGRLITAEEVARVALWLASAECPLTGQVLTVDGGWSISG